MKGALVRIALLLGGTCLALLMAEWFVRHRQATPDVAFLDESAFRLSENKILAYEMGPRVGPGGHPIPFKNEPGSVNTWGFRDAEHEVAKAPGVQRILLLGDSIAYGLRVEPYADTAPARLQVLLNADGIATEVINFGVPGYDTGQEIELLKTRGLALEPDIVIVAYCFNDHVGTTDEILYPLLQRARGNAVLGKPWLGRLVSRSALYRLVRYRLVPDLFRQRSADDMLRDFNREDAVPAALQDLGRLREEHGFRALVVVFPLLETLEDYKHADKQLGFGPCARRADCPCWTC